MRKEILALTLLIATTGCTTISHERFLGDIKKPRTTFNVSIEFTDKVDGRCREHFAETNTFVLPVGLVQLNGCAVIPLDSELKPGEVPHCKLVLPEENWHGIFEHEIYHCMGYGH